MSDLVRREEVRFRSGELTLAGTFAVPAADGPVPAVLMLQGSGRTDRDDNAKALAVDVFPQLSAAIERAGLATFRYDKRGVGGSAGDYFRSDFDDLLTDAVAAVEWLGARAEVDASRVIALGHSEGAVVSVRVAAGAAPVAGVVLPAGAAQTGEQILTWQGRQVADSLTGAASGRCACSASTSPSRSRRRSTGSAQAALMSCGYRAARSMPPGCASSWPTTRTRARPRRRAGARHHRRPRPAGRPGRPT